MLTCRTQSLQAGEALAGTAPHALHWLLVQYDGAWGHKALEESDLPAEVKAAVTRLTAEMPPARAGLIKQRGDAGRTVFAITAQAHNPTMFRYELDSWAPLVAARAADLFAGRVAGARAQVSPVFLVCTNGKRDRCCAEVGIPVFDRLRTQGVEVWQTSHVGGHRFAANLVCFPHGVLYGRLDESSAAQVVRLYDEGRMDLSHCRGRTAFAEPAQAAEILLRQAWGEDRIEYVRSAQVEGSRVVIHRAEGEKVTVEVARETGDQMVEASCGAGKADPVTRYRLV